MTRRVNRGDPLRIRAEDWNKTLDLIRRASGGDPPTDGQAPPRAASSQTAVLIRNDSGADVARFGVLGIDAPLIAADAELAEFQTAVRLAGVTPSETAHQGAFAIALEPIANGAIARAVVDGVVQCQVSMTAEGDPFAEVKDADATQLVSGPTGSARILWAEAGTGTKWAIVALGSAATAGFWAELTTFDDPGWSWEAREVQSDGTIVAPTPAVTGSSAFPVNPGDGITGEVVWMRVAGQDQLGAPFYAFYSTDLPADTDYIDVQTDAPDGYRIEHRLTGDQPVATTNHTILEWDGGAKTLTPYTVDVNDAGHVVSVTAGDPIDLSGLADGDELVASEMGAVPGYLIDVLAVPGLWLSTAVNGAVVDLTHNDPQVQDHQLTASGDAWVVPTNANVAGFDAKGHHRAADKLPIAFTHADPQAQAVNFDQFPDVTTRYVDGDQPKINIANATGNISVDAKGHVRSAASAIGSQLASLQMKSDNGSVVIDGEITVEPGLLINLNAAAQDPGSAVQSMGHDNEGPLAPDTDTWTAGGADGLAVWKKMREHYDHNASPPILYGYARLYTYDRHGNLYSVSGETRYVIDEPIEGVVAT